MKTPSFCDVTPQRRDKLLAALDDAAVQQKICAIVSEHLFAANAPSHDGRGLEGRYVRLQEDMEQKEQTLIALRQRQRDAEARAQAAERRAQALEADNRQLQGRLQEMVQENESLQKKLMTHFAEGMELYAAYGRLSPYLRSLLTAALPRAGFEAFIVGLAQDRSMGDLWDAAREALVRGDTEGAALLWRLFRYSLRLVNQRNKEDIYCLSTVAAGDRYDVDRQALVPGSNVQGKVREVCLPGYENKLTGECIRKSLVCL